MLNTTTIGELWKDAGWRAALTILLGSRELSDDVRVWRHVDLDRREIGFRKILECGTFSSVERSLLEVAASLCSGELKINLWTVFHRLDDRSTRLAIVAICNFRRLRGLENPRANRRSGDSAPLAQNT